MLLFKIIIIKGLAAAAVDRLSITDKLLTLNAIKQQPSQAQRSTLLQQLKPSTPTISRPVDQIPKPIVSPVSPIKNPQEPIIKPQPPATNVSKPVVKESLISPPSPPSQPQQLASGKETPSTKEVSNENEENNSSPLKPLRTNANVTVTGPVELTNDHITPSGNSKSILYSVLATLGFVCVLLGVYGAFYLHRRRMITPIGEEKFVNANPFRGTLERKNSIAKAAPRIERDESGKFVSPSVSTNLPDLPVPLKTPSSDIPANSTNSAPITFAQNQISLDAPNTDTSKSLLNWKNLGQ